MAVDPFTGTLEFAKVLITVFVMCYAYFFLKRSEDFEDRRPWFFLFIASMFLFTVEVIATLQLFKGGLFNDPFFMDVKEFVEFCFLAFFLFSFIYQHHMLLRKGMLVIEQRSKRGGWWKRFKRRYVSFEQKLEHAMEREEGPDPEEEIEEELSELEEDEELKSEEEFVSKVAGEKND